MDGAQAAAVAATAAPHGHRLNLPRTGPQLAPADAPRVAQMAAEIFFETRGTGRFKDSPVGEFAEAASILVRFSDRPAEISRQPRKARHVHARPSGS